MTAMILHTLEARSARVFATLDARPQLGALWRRFVALSEATAALSMEDVPVPEQDILAPITGSSMVHGDPQAAQIARQIHSFIQRPGDMMKNPGDVFDRAMRAGRLTSLVDEDLGGRVAYHTSEEAADWAFARQDFEIAAPDILRHEAPVTFRLMALAGMVNKMLPERVPIAERLIFMAAESAMRREDRLSDPIVGRVLTDDDHNISAHWTLTPSLALSRGGYRTWSPASTAGRQTLAERLNASLDQNVGRLGQLNNWIGEVEGFAGQTRKSRRRDLAQLFMKTPVLSAPHVAEELGVTKRAARSLLDDACASNIISLLTQRSTYRLWSVPFMARLIQDKPVQARRRNLSDLAVERSQASPARSSTSPAGQNMTAGLSESMQSAARDLDDAMAKADLILSRYTVGNARG